MEGITITKGKVCKLNKFRPISDGEIPTKDFLYGVYGEGTETHKLIHQYKAVFRDGTENFFCTVEGVSHKKRSQMDRK